MPEPAASPRSGLRRSVAAGVALGRRLGALVGAVAVIGAGAALGAPAAVAAGASAAGGPAAGAPVAGGPAAGAPVAGAPAVGAHAAGGPVAGAPPAGSAASSPPSGPSTLCQVTDPRLPELSGLVVAGKQMLAMNDGGDEVTLYVLDFDCRVVAVHTAPVDPYDPEDLALGPDGTVWFADTGDNLARRSTVALLALHPDNSTSVYRLTYPDGPHDAEALLLPPDGTPYIVTKEVLGNSGVYRPGRGLVDGGTVPLVKVAALHLAVTGTPGGPAGRAGQLMVTGGAVSADGNLLALRTYTDAYVWRLQGSDVPRALAAAPERIALPPAPQGEAISFDGDGRLVVAGEGLPGAVTAVPVPAALAAAAASKVPAARGAVTGGHAGVPTLTAGIIAAVTATLAVWIGGKFRARRA